MPSGWQASRLGSGGDCNGSHVCNSQLFKLNALVFISWKGVPGEMLPGMKKATLCTCHIYIPAPGLQTHRHGLPDMQLKDLEFKVDVS